MGTRLKEYELEGIARSAAMAPLSAAGVTRLLDSHAALSKDWSEVERLLQRLGPAWAELRSPASSPVGLALAAASLLVMAALAMAKRDTGRRLHSHAVLADGDETKLCAYLSAILLQRSRPQCAMGWWWAHPVAALALNEGREAWRGYVCCD